MLTAGTAHALPGEKAIGRLNVGETRDGSPADLPVALVNGQADGPRLYVQAASDGDELNGVGVVSRVFPRLNADCLSGEVILIGIANIYAFQQTEHRNPFDDTKLNRTYPGDTSGSVSERIAAATYELVRDADLALDLHQASTSRMIDEVRVRCGRYHRLHDDCLELAKVFGCGHIFDKKGPAGQLARVAPDAGIPTVDPELGGAVGWDERSIRRGVDGFFNVLRFYGLYPGSLTPDEQIRARALEHHIAPCGGLVRFREDLGARMTAGEVLFEVTDIFGRTKESAIIENPGIFWRSRRLPQVATGEYVASVSTKTDRY